MQFKTSTIRRSAREGITLGVFLFLFWSAIAFFAGLVAKIAPMPNVEVFETTNPDKAREFSRQCDGLVHHSFDGDLIIVECEKAP